MKYQIFKQKFSEIEGLNLRIREAKQGFLFFAFSTLLIALQFGLYITDSSILGLMDLEGWLFFITSCISHAAIFALIPYLLSLIFTFCRCTKTARIVQIVGIILLCIINYLNSQVYAIYHFHINGFVLSMVFGEGAGEIFQFRYNAVSEGDSTLSGCGSYRYRCMVCLISSMEETSEGIRLDHRRMHHRQQPLCSSLPYLWRFLSAAFRDEEQRIAALLLPNHFEWSVAEVRMYSS